MDFFAVVVVVAVCLKENGVILANEFSFGIIRFFRFLLLFFFFFYLQSFKGRILMRYYIIIYLKENGVLFIVI